MPYELIGDELRCSKHVVCRVGAKVNKNDVSTKKLN